MITIIAAIDRNRAIGYQNRLLFRLPADMKRFKALTTGHTVVMGRKTFESLPKGALPDRRNLVISSQKSLSFPGAEIFPSLAAALESCPSDEQIFVIGGASIYAQALPLADRLCLTEVNASAPEADAYFPAFSSADWREQSRDSHQADERHPHPYAFVDYTRR